MKTQENQHIQSFPFKCMRVWFQDTCRYQNLWILNKCLYKMMWYLNITYTHLPICRHTSEVLWFGFSSRPQYSKLSVSWLLGVYASQETTLFAPISSSSSGIKFAMKYSSVTLSGFSSNSSSLPVYATEILNSSKSSVRTGIKLLMLFWLPMNHKCGFLKIQFFYIYFLYLSEWQKSYIHCFCSPKCSQQLLLNQDRVRS